MTETPDPAQAFLDEVAGIAEASGLFEDVFRDPDRFTVVVHRDGALHSLELSNLELGTRELPPAAREDEILRWLTAMTRSHEGPSSWVAARPLLMPTLRTPSACSSVALEPRREDFALRDVAPMLRCLTVIDDGERVVWLERSDLEVWGVAEELARQVALENLAALAGDGIERLPSRSGAPMFQVRSGDGLESSRLLLPGWLAEFAPTVDGLPICAVPHRGALLVTGDANPEAVAELAELATAEYAVAPGPLSPALYVITRDGEGFEPLVLHDEHPAARAVALGHARLAVDEYATQAETLGRLREAGVVSGVAEAAELEVHAEGSRVQTAAVWPREGVWLLPEADVVVLVDAGERRAVPWEEVASEQRGCLERVDHLDPPRWRTVRWFE